MLFNSTTSSLLYFMWPEINYFPAYSRQDADSFWRHFEQFMSWILIPLISLVGFLGNLLNIILLIRGQLNKSSTCLILALAVADSLYLLGTNIMPIHLYARGQQFGFDYPEPLAKTLFYTYVTQRTLEQSAKIAALTLPFIITLDRLVAVLAPYRYSRIMTVNRVGAALCLLTLLSTSYAIFSSFKFTFKYAYDPSYLLEAKNMTYSGMIAKSDFFLAHDYAIKTFQHITVIISGPTPLVLTIIGCFIVGIRIQTQEKKRNSLFANIHKPGTNNYCVNNAKFKSLKSVSTFSFFKKTITATKKCIISTTHVKETRLQIPKNLTNVNIKETQTVNTEKSLSSSPIKYVDINNLLDSPSNVLLKCDNMQANVLRLSSNNLLQNVSQLNCDLNPTQVHVIKPSNDNSHACVPKFTSEHPNRRLSKSKKNKTTRTLLSVCGMYCVANIINFVVLIFFDQSSIQPDVAIGLETSRKLVLVLNSSCNFLFYVGLNKNFRDGYRKLLGLCVPCRCKKNKMTIILRTMIK